MNPNLKAWLIKVGKGAATHAIMGGKAMVLAGIMTGTVAGLEYVAAQSGTAEGPAKYVVLGATYALAFLKQRPTNKL